MPFHVDLTSVISVKRSSQQSRETVRMAETVAEKDPSTPGTDRQVAVVH